jgi:crotonobetainyl-CoA:carnitine CoA-transferase CaiB-like acyl-CoA transferase
MLLSGYRALDLTDEKGLLCGQILGGLGVDVIKVEKPGGDPARNIPPFYKDIPHPEKSLYWMYCNRNKRGITLDIETADGREIFKQLVKSADFVFESFDPGYMEELGLGYENLDEVNPRIIMTSITPYGQTGPYSNFKYADLPLFAMGSVMTVCGESDRAPVRTPFQTGFYGGLHGAMGSMMAHHWRELSGEGQHVDVSMQQAGILTLMIGVEVWDLYRIQLPRMGQVYYYPREKDALIVRTIYPCKDGWVHIQFSGGPEGIIRSSNELLRMTAEAGLAGEYADYDFHDYDGQSITQDERLALENALIRFLETKTKKELMEIALDKELILGPLFNIEEIWESPHYAERNYWEKVDHPELGDTITYPGAPVKISQAPWRTTRPAPLIGEHNHEIFVDELGLSREQCTLLKSSGII